MNFYVKHDTFYPMTKQTNKKIISTYDRLVAKMSPERKKEFDAGYKELIFSELLIALAQKKYKHAKKLINELESLEVN